MKRALIIMLVALVAMTTVFAQGLEETSASFPDPERTITIIVPQGAGGGTDTFARKLAAKMTEMSGQNFIVENITGNSTGTGTNDVINSEPDGYKMLMYGTYTIVGTSVGATDGAAGLDFIAGLTLEPFVIGVKADSQWNTLQDLIDYAKANPGQVTIGNAGATGTTAVVACGLNVACGNCFNVIPANGGAELQTWVMGGHCQVGIFSQTEIVDGIKPLAFLGETRSLNKNLADVPTIVEAGYGDLTIPYGCFRGLAVPKGTPDEAKNWLANVVEKAFYSDDFQSFMAEKGYLQTFSTLADTDAYNAQLMQDLQPALEAAGLIKK